MKINRIYEKSREKFALIKIEHHVTRDVAIRILCREYRNSLDGFPEPSEPEVSKLIRDRLKSDGEEPLHWWTDGASQENVESVTWWAERTVDRLWPMYTQD